MTTREVVLDGGSPWGFRLHGGADVNQPLRISRVNPGSKAAFRGVREGDIITSINGHSTKEISNAEAHAFLRNSGDTLKLGLNEEYSGSPKRRQYRTVQHQETHSETCKKSSITSYTLSSSKTVSQTEVINDPASKVNGNATTVNGESTNDPPSTLSSNSSTPSTITETGSSHQEDAMPDNASRSRRKRSRNQRKKNNKNGGKQVANEPSESEYRVDSPTGEKKKMPGKSKSLDDDEIVKIQELSEVSSSEEKIDENKGVVSEVESEPESQEVLISPEEEKTLRNFLEGLNLVNSPEDAAKQVFDNVDVKTRRAKKKAVLEQYFAPLAQNPRYLDVINEENSDLSDREQQPHHLKQGTPELEIVDRGVVWQKKMQAHYCAPISPILVGVKFFEPPVATQAICTNAPTPNPVEKVFIEDSDSSSPEFFEATSSNSSVPELNQEKEVVEETRRMEIVVEKNRANSRNVDQEIVGKSQQIHILVRKNDSVIKTDSAEILSQLTPPPTPDDMSPKGEAVDTTLIQTAEDVRIKLENCVKDEEEVEKICRNINKTIYTNVISPPAPSRSPSLSSDNSSRSSSLVTAKYNPNSSVADIESIRQEIDKIEVQPSTLRELCLNYLISQPFGAEVLQELAEVSLTLENLTSNLSDPKKCELPGRNEWVGVATEDSKVLLCLSPSQKEELEKSRKMDNEGGKLLELHEKFLSRTFCESKNEVVITSIKDDAKLSGNNGNRLLAIIREDPSASESKPEEFYVEKKGKGATLPRSINMDSARLKAKDLTEWLQLARRKSTSESNLTALRDTNSRTRRTSLPQEFYQEQMHYLLEKEREIQRELEFLEEEKRKLSAEMAPSRQFHPEDYHISRQGDYAECKRSRPTSMPVASEFFRQQMYEEYLDKFAAHEDRKQHKVIKVTTPPRHSENKSMTGLEEEFMDMVKQKQKLGKLNREDGEGDSDVEPVKGVRKLPKHLQEFVDITKLAENSPRDGVWTPGQKQEFNLPEVPARRQRDEPVIPVWTPKSATSSPIAERKEFKPVKFESPVLGRKQFSRTESQESSESSKEPPWKIPETSSDTGIVLSTTLQKRLPTSHSSPGFNNFSTTRLPRAQNPTITLLQKAREGQLPKGASYIDQEQSHKRPHNERTPFVTPVYEIKHEYTSESDSERPRKMADLGPRKFPGVGPTTKDGMPLILRSEVKDANQSKWYKKMYDTIHKQKPHRDEFVTVKYRHPRGQFPYASGYLSEPEPGAYDSDYTDYKYATLDRRRAPNKENEYTMSSTIPRTTAPQEIVKYPNEGPRRIENYTPGHSSISDKEAKEWWDEVMDIFDGQFEQQKRPPLQPQPPPPHAHPKSFINQALKESGYESDSTLIFRKRDDLAQQLSPLEQKEAYKFVQQGGDIPLHGFRKPAPERPKESPRKYLENEVTIHYKTPVRQEIKEYLSEDELAHRQAEAMKKIYQEERRRKYLQELQDMNNRRHTDNFIPSQKSPISLNRYDDFDDLAPPVKPRPRSPEPRLMARALYNFVGQTARELTFRKGDLIYVRRQVDKNWYEGELNAMVGLFPVNYVEIVPHDTSKSTLRKPHEGQARAKYNFVAQTHLELSLAKGELVVVTRKVDDNWFEGKIGGRKGIFPVSYVEILIDPNDPPPPSTKPVASPAAHSLLLNGSAGGKESMGSHSYTPHASGNQLTSSRYHAKPVQITNSGSYGSLNSKGSTISPVNQALHIETQSEPVPYRALYKYVPQNDDELELFEGDTVYVLEKCDDGWYVGSSDRTGAFGTFPGNYVEKI